MNRDGELFPRPPDGSPCASRSRKPDTGEGWETVRRYEATEVPLAVFLHQRAYGGSFGSCWTPRVASVGTWSRMPWRSSWWTNAFRTFGREPTSSRERFGLTVKPAPDFVLFDSRTDTLKAILECKGASDGGTARDKARRFRALRAESQRLGGVPLFAVLAGIGRRTNDALGPVIRDTDGRTFTLATLPEVISTDPLRICAGWCRQPRPPPVPTAARVSRRGGARPSRPASTRSGGTTRTVWKGTGPRPDDRSRR